MKIAVNTRLLLPNRLEGIGTFTHNVLRRMVLDHPEHEFYFIFDRPYSQEYIYADNVTPIVVGPPARHPLLYLIWFELSVQRVLRKLKPDVFLSPDGYLSLRSSIPQVPVIHDLNFEYFPEFFSWIDRKHFQFFFPRFARKARRVATVSQFSKDDLVRLYGIDQSLIDVVYAGVDPLYTQVDQHAVNEFKKATTGGQDYFVFVGGLYLRKNLSTVIRAFDAFKERTGSPVKFVIAGKSYAETKPLFDLHKTLKHKDDILFLGRIEPREKIPVLLGGALSLVYVSLLEGFGLPIAEAMSCGTPVITGNITAMAEIADDAAVLADPYDYTSIASAMQKVAESPDLRAQLRIAGMQRAAEFTWQRTADALWECVTRSA
jgi:glycosyltransferase involved in cell wall biosynthesis